MLKWFYLAAAVVGTVVPWWFFAQFIGREGFDLPLFMSSMFVNGAAGGFSADVLISAVVFWVWSYGDAQRSGIRPWWIVIPATLLVGLSLAFPLYLFLRENTRTSEVRA